MSNECYGFISDSYNLIMSTHVWQCATMYSFVRKFCPYTCNKPLNNNNTTVSFSLCEFCVKREVAIIHTVLAHNGDERVVQVVNVINRANKYTISKNNFHVIN